MEIPTLANIIVPCSNLKMGKGSTSAEVGIIYLELRIVHILAEKAD